MIRFGNALSLALCTTWIALWNSVGMADSLDEKDPPEMQRMRDTLSNTMTGGGTAEDYVKRADECIAAVDAAIKAGLSPTKEFTFFGGDPSEPPPAGMRWSKNGQLITTAPTAKKAICMAAMATGLAGPLSHTHGASTHVRVLRDDDVLVFRGAPRSVVFAQGPTDGARVFSGRADRGQCRRASRATPSPSGIC